jgi:hypothetical protein
MDPPGPPGAPGAFAPGLRVASVDVGVKKLGFAVLRSRGRQTAWEGGADSPENATVRFIASNCCVEYIENIDLLLHSRLANQSGTKAMYLDPAERSDMVMSGLVEPRLALLGLARDPASGQIAGDPSLSAVVVERQPVMNKGMEIICESICCTLHMLLSHVVRSDVRVHVMSGSWKMKICELFAGLTGIDAVKTRSKYEWNKMASVATVAYLRDTVEHFMTERAAADFDRLPEEKRPDVCDAILQGVAMMWKLERSLMGKKPRQTNKRAAEQPARVPQRKRSKRATRPRGSRLAALVRMEQRGHCTLAQQAEERSE